MPFWSSKKYYVNSDGNNSNTGSQRTTSHAKPNKAFQIEQSEPIADLSNSIQTATPEQAGEFVRESIINADRDNEDMNNQIKYSVVPQKEINNNNVDISQQKAKQLQFQTKFETLDLDDSKKKVDKKGKEKKEKKTKKQKPKSEEKDVSMLGLFRYADCKDKILITIGTIFALLSAGIYPIMFLLYGQVAGTLVDFSKDKLKNSTISNKTTSYSNNTCVGAANTLTETGSFDEKMKFNIIFYVSAGVASLLFNYLACACWSVSAERQIKRIRNLLFHSILRQEIGFFDKNTPGNLNSRITSNITTIEAAFGFKFADTISMLGRGLACAILALVTAIKFSVVFLGLAPIISICTSVMVIMIKKYTIKEFAAYGKAGVIAQEALSAIRTVYTFGLQSNKIKTYSNNLKDAESMSIKKGLITGIFSSATTFLFNAMFAIAIFYGVYLIRSDCVLYTPGGIIQSLFCMITTTLSIGQALPFIRDVSEARAAARSVFHIIEKKSTIDYETKGGQVPTKLVGNIDFENVQFSYPQRKDMKILKDFNLHIPAGRTVALCGKSGGGKSTVIQLLERFYDPDSGVVKIDGVNIKDLDLNWLRDNIALVQQEPVLFATTIRENIRLGRLDATDEEIEEVAKISNAHNFIISLKDGYDTLVGERGSQLSGGQKQRIAIARAIVRNPRILLLDEATSALDLESEKMVQDALDKAKIGRTTIIIAHRLSTIRNADLIVGVANGKVEETGTHDQLMNLQGIYYDLVTMQTKEVKEKEIKEVESEENLDVVAEILEEKETEEEDDIDSEQEVEDDKDFEKTAYHSNGKISHQKEDKSKTKKSKSKTKKFSLLKLERLLIKMNKPEILHLIIGCIGQMINGATFPAVALAFSEIYTIFAIQNPNEQEQKSLEFLGIILGISAGAVIATLAYMYSFAVAGARLTRRLRARMFKSMMRQEIGWFDLDENRSSVLATRLSASVPLCKGLTVDKLSLLSQGISGVGFAVIVALVLNWKLALVMMTFVPIMFGSGIISARAMMNTNVKGKTTIEEGGKITTEVVENIRTVVSLGRQDHFLAQFKSIFNKKFKKALWRLQIQAFFYSLSNSMLFFVQAVAFGYGYTLVRDENLRVADLYRIYATLTFSSMILGRVFSQMPDQNKASDATKAAFKIIQRQSKIDALSDDGLRPSTVKGEIEFRDVHFQYPTRNNKILKGLNLKVNQGETNALVGQSGCGKSTTIQLLLRFYDVDKGQVLLDGVDIRDLNLNWLRSQIGLVSQEPVLFNISILENIKYGDISRENIPFEEIIDAAIKANIHEKIQTFPDKYNTMVGTKGGQLSGGEKQRVAIARALLRKPKILLLDEATSALDTQSEEVVQDALDKAQKGRTCICIAHRLSTIQDAPKISVFKNGRVVEEGSHAQLLDKKDVYYNLQLHAVNPT